MLYDPNYELVNLMIPETLGIHLRAHSSQTKDKSIDFTNFKEVLKEDYFLKKIIVAI